MNGSSTLEQLLLTQPALWRGRSRTGLAAPDPLDGQAHEQGLPTGFAALDAALPLGGWEMGSLTEIMTRQEGIGELSLLLPALRALTADHEKNNRRGNRWGNRWAALISPPYQPYAPALVNAGLRLDRLLIIEAGQHTLWATEQALRSGACGVVVAWPPQSAAHEPFNRRSSAQGRSAGFDKPSIHAHRRLQLAAETHQAWAVLYRPHTCAAEHSPAALRLVLEAMLPERLHIDIIKARKGQPRSLSIDWSEFDQSQGTLWPTPRSGAPSSRSAFVQRPVIRPDTTHPVD